MKRFTLAPTPGGGFLLPQLAVWFLLTTLMSVSARSARAEEVDEPSSEGNEISSDFDDPLLDPLDPEFLDSDTVYETSVHGYHLRPTDETTGFAETIVVKEELQAMNTVSEILSKTTGVQVRSLGGLGSYGAASIRGSTSAQVPVYLDGILLNIGGFSSVNLGNLSLEIFDSIEVYRGTTPVRLGLGGIGGALNLVTRQFEEPSTEVSASYGSFQTWRLVTLRADRIADLDILVLLSTQGSLGDFDHLNRNGTPLNSSDDKIEPRQNNQHTAYTGLLKLRRKVGAWTWTLLDDLFVKRQGIAGIESVKVQDASLRMLQNTLALRAARSLGKKSTLSLGLSHLFLGQQFDDPKNEIGVGHQSIVSRAHNVGMEALTRLVAGENHRTDLRLEGKYDDLLEKSVIENKAADPNSRVRLGFGVEHQWQAFTDFWGIAAFRFAWHHSEFAGGEIPGSVQEVSAKKTDDWFWSPSLGIRYEVVSGFTLRANAGRYVRAPDISELFGDRGSVVGNPELKPEVGINVDAGFSWILTDFKAISALRIDAAWFGSWADNLIAYVQNSQNTIRPENVNAARILGVETGLRLHLLEWVSLEANYTFLHGINQSESKYYNGNRLPGRPAHELYGRLEIGRVLEKWGFAGWFDVDYAGTNYLDRANLNEDTLARLLLGLGGRVQYPAAGLTLTVEVHNLLDTITIEDKYGRDRPLRDYKAFPLPGRTVMATLHVKI